jgi:hypothetical protein
LPRLGNEAGVQRRREELGKDGEDVDSHGASG